MRKPKKPAMTLSLTIEEQEQLTERARELGYFWGSSPSPSKLVAAIARGEQIEKLREMQDINLQLQRENAVLQTKLNAIAGICV